ncbi:MAG: DUF4968 domain-containing protein, partial [Bacteroidales bacterium]|nr:DUF4968 domain-containing protein [Candidatus Cryptobacteroides faecihippi]
MKRYILAIAFLTFGIAALAGQPHRIKVDGGRTVTVEACSESIFRVRMTPGKEFSESLMERYGLIKTDWDEVKTTEKTSGAEWTLSTGAYSLTVNKKSGAIRVTDAKGGKVIREIRFLPKEDSFTQKMREIVNDKYADLQVANNGGGIIGDDNGKFGEVDNSEVPAADNIDVITISMEDGERFYGGGSTSRDHIQHRGELLRMWTTYQHTEIPMPFMMSSRGWGIYVNLTSKSFFDLGTIKNDRFNIMDMSAEADFYLMMGK